MRFRRQTLFVSVDKAGNCLRSLQDLVMSALGAASKAAAEGIERKTVQNSPTSMTPKDDVRVFAP